MYNSTGQQLCMTKCHTPTSDKVTSRLGNQYLNSNSCVHATSLNQSFAALPPAARWQKTVQSSLRVPNQSNKSKPTQARLANVKNKTHKQSILWAIHNYCVPWDGAHDGHEKTLLVVSTSAHLMHMAAWWFPTKKLMEVVAPYWVRGCLKWWNSSWVGDVTPTHPQGTHHNNHTS
jgi:hypothetical protein